MSETSRSQTQYAKLVCQNDRFVAAMMAAPEARAHAAAYARAQPPAKTIGARALGYRFQSVPRLIPPAGGSLIDSVLDAVCRAHGLSRPDLLSKSRAAHLFQARCVAAALLRAHTGLKPGRIGKLLGGRDRTTVIHALNTIEREATRFAPMIARAEELL